MGKEEATLSLRFPPPKKRERENTYKKENNKDNQSYKKTETEI